MDVCRKRLLFLEVRDRWVELYNLDEVFIRFCAIFA